MFLGYGCGGGVTGSEDLLCCGDLDSVIPFGCGCGCGLNAKTTNKSADVDVNMIVNDTTINKDLK